MPAATSGSAPAPAATSSSAAPSPAASSGFSPPATVTGTLSIESVDQGSIENVVKAFEAANPGVKVNLTTGAADQYQQQIRTQLASGTGPDVMTVWPGNGNPGATFVLAKPGYLLDLSDQPWAAKYPAGIKKVAQYNGKTYNAIFGLNGIGAVYNQQALTKAGLTPPTTWTGLLQFCKAAAAKGTPAFALGIQDGWVNQLIPYTLVATDEYSKNPDFDTQMAAGQATFASSEWTTAVAQYQQMWKTGCFQPSPLGTSYVASQSLVATGKTLGIVQGNWVVALLKTINPSSTYTMTALPATDNPASEIMPAAPGAGYGVNAKAKNKALALQFISYLMSPAGMSLFNKEQGSLPTIAGSGSVVDPSLSVLTTFINSGKTVPFMDQLWPNAKVQQDMLTGLAEIVSNQSTTAKMLAQMDTDYKAGS